MRLSPFSILLCSLIGIFLSQAYAYPYKATRTLYCEFWHGNQLLTLPDAFMIYDPKAKVVWTRSGKPAVTRVYKNVSSNVGAPPYYHHGFSVTMFGDVSILSISDQEFDTIPILAYLLNNHEATWGSVPGFPDKLNGGLCFYNPLFPDNFRGW